MLKRLVTIWAMGLLCLTVLASSCYAASAPVATLESVSNNMISSLRRNRTTIRTNRALVYRLARKILLPHVAMDTMSRAVLGRANWNRMNSQQKHTFKREFTSLLIRTYAEALASYTDETIQFYPIRGGVQGSRVQVHSKILRRSGPSIAVSYRMLRIGSRWKVYDMSVEGVSLISSFRSQFSAEISQGGIEDLLVKMGNHNRGR